jgi:hypothetical protein
MPTVRQRPIANGRDLGTPKPRRDRVGQPIPLFQQIMLKGAPNSKFDTIASP